MDILTDNLSGTLPASSIPQPRQSHDEATDGALTQHITYPESDAAVLTLTGEVDAVTAPRLAEMLRSRLCSRLRRMVLDLSELGFLGVVGVRTLMVAELRARATETELVVVAGGNREITRALSATAALHQLRFHAGPAGNAAAIGSGGYWARCPYSYFPASVGPEVARWPGEA